VIPGPGHVLAVTPLQTLHTTQQHNNHFLLPGETAASPHDESPAGCVPSRSLPG